jgi:iron complex transport system permease protein
VSRLALAGLARWGVTGAAFAGAVLAVVLTLVLAKGVQNTAPAAGRRGGGRGAGRRRIAGAAHEPDIMQAMQSFMLGSTAFAGWPACALMLWVLMPAGAGL